MSDFTREELVLIQRLINRDSVDMSDAVMLRGKIQSLIENYCYHEYELVGCGAEAYGKCCKCGDIPRV